MIWVWIFLGLVVLAGVTSPIWGPSRLLWGDPDPDNEPEDYEYEEYR